MEVGFYKSQKGSFTLLNRSDDINSTYATEVHESIHKQLTENTSFGLLLKSLDLFAERTTNVQLKEIAIKLSSTLFEYGRFAQESIATFCSTVYLMVNDSEKYSNYSDYLPAEYIEYIKPFEKYLNSDNLVLEAMDGAINIGLLVFNAPLSKKISRNRDVYDIDSYKAILNFRKLNFQSRLYSIIEVVQNHNIKLEDIVPGNKSEYLDKLLRKKNFWLTKTKNVKESDLEELAWLINSFLFKKDKETRQFFLDSVGIRENDQNSFDDVLDRSTIFLVREPKATLHYEPEDMYNFIQWTFNSNEIEINDISPIFELRGEDLLFSNDFNQIEQLPKVANMVNFTPIAGDTKYFCFSEFYREDVKNLITFFCNKHSRILLSSNRFDFKNHLFVGYKPIENSCVVVHSLNVQILDKFISVLDLSLTNEYFFTGLNEEDNVQFLFVHHFNKQYNYYTLFPLSLNTMFPVRDIFKANNIRQLLDSEIELHFDFIVPIMVHLKEVGWATINQIENETIDILIPNKEQLNYWIEDNNEN